jgi:diaminohydroxyphosphoribosylaminopyrimidine deaminase/5-amino-6-(5-phosphoribosylamino)uracil reductase
VVFDGSLRLPATSRLARTTSTGPVTVVTTVDAPSEAEAQLVAAGVKVIRAPRSTEGRIDLGHALDLLGNTGIVDLLVEGGAHLAGALIETDLVDEILWFAAPIALGAGGAPALAGPSPVTPDDAPRYRVDELERVGEDVLIVLRRRS